MDEPLSLGPPIAAGSGLDHRLPSGAQPGANPPAAPGPAEILATPAPPTQLDIGTTVAALVRAAVTAPDAPPLGTLLMLRILAPPDAAAPVDLLVGTVLDSPAGETLIQTAIGLLALERLNLPPGMTIAFQRLSETLPEAAEAPTRASGWPALDEALELLAEAAPPLAAGLRQTLLPESGPALAATLLFLLGAVYRGNWPAAAIATALGAAGHDALTQRLAEDGEALRQLGDDAATGDWRVLMLPLLDGALVLPVRLFLRRPKPQPDAATPEESRRFLIEVELGHFGPVQIDGLLRGQRLDLMLRSHRALAAALRQGAQTVFARATAEWGLAGTISFSTTPTFTVAPLAALRRHVELKT